MIFQINLYFISFILILFAYSEGHLYSQFPYMESNGINYTKSFESNFTLKNNSTSTKRDWTSKMPNRSFSIEKLKIQKCCDEGKVLIRDEFEEWSCQDVFNYSFEAKIYKSPDDENNRFTISESEFQNFYKVQMPNCTEVYPRSVVNKEEIWFRILENGQPVIGLNFWLWPIWLPTSDEHCIDVTFDAINATNNNTVDTPTEVLLFCKIEGFETYTIHRIIYGTTFIISAFCLLCTVLVYYLVRRHYNIHGWEQVSYFVSMFLFYIAEGSRIFTKLDGLHIKVGHLCFFHAVFAQYFSLAASSSITVLGFDMLNTLRKMQPTNSRKTKIKSVILYLILPYLIPLIGLVLGLTYNHFFNPNASKEEIGIFKFGHYRCSSSAWHVGAIIQSASFILNIIYFITTAVAVIKALRSTQFAKGKSNRKFIIESVKVVMKIALVMGVTFTLTVSEFCMGVPSKPFAWYWVFSRVVLFGLLGFWLFLAFGCTRKNRKALLQTYPDLHRLVNLSTTVNSTSSVQATFKDFRRRRSNK